MNGEETRMRANPRRQRALPGKGGIGGRSQRRAHTLGTVDIISKPLDIYYIPGPDGQPLGHPTLEIEIDSASRVLRGVRIRYGDRGEEGLPPGLRSPQP